MLLSRITIAVSLLAALGVPAAGPAAAKQPSVTVREFRFVGFDGDVVGQGWSLAPDGVKDGHFVVVLVRPKGAGDGRGFMLARCPSKPTLPSFAAIYQTGAYNKGELGCEGARFFADTAPASKRALLQPEGMAAFRDGKRLTLDGKSSRLLLPSSSKPVRFDLYVNGGTGCPILTGHANAPDCRAAFAPGQRYLLMVKGGPPPGGSAWISRSGDKVPEVTSPQAELRNLRFVGLDRDVLGPGPNDPPDGRPDAHWTVEVATPAGPRMVQTIALERAEAVTDRAEDPLHWCTPGCPGQPPADPRYRMLYITVDGKRVLIPAGDKFLNIDLPYTTSAVRLEFWATEVDPSAFTPGQRFRASVQIAPEEGSPTGSGRDALPRFNPATPWLTLPGG